MKFTMHYLFQELMVGPEIYQKNKDDLKSKYQIENFYNNYTFYDLGFNLRPTEITGFLGNNQIKFFERNGKY